MVYCHNCKAETELDEDLMCGACGKDPVKEFEKLVDSIIKKNRIVFDRLAEI